VIRATSLFWLGIAVAVVWGLFHVKHAVREMERELASVQQEIAKTRASTRVLEAEWAYLDRPERLRALASRYLGMVPADSARVGEADDLPLRFDLASSQSDETGRSRVTSTASRGSDR
jgi:cell division protein FtsL